LRRQSSPPPRVPRKIPRGDQRPIGPWCGRGRDQSRPTQKLRPRRPSTQHKTETQTRTARPSHPDPKGAPNGHGLASSAASVVLGNKPQNHFSPPQIFMKLPRAELLPRRSRVLIEQEASDSSSISSPALLHLLACPCLRCCLGLLLTSGWNSALVFRHC
jgi:hypothetical protein